VGYFLGIDVGTTWTAAAVWRDGRNDMVGLGNRAQAIPTVVLLRDDETVLVGEAAARRAATEPLRVSREFKRRLGDPTPIIVGGARRSGWPTSTACSP
jgi:molecular chaperone DnaK